MGIDLPKLAGEKCVEEQSSLPDVSYHCRSDLTEKARILAVRGLESLSEGKIASIFIPYDLHAPFDP